MGSRLIDMTVEQVRDVLRKRMESRKWWVLIPSAESMGIIRAIHETHYKDAPRTEFTMLAIEAFDLPVIVAAKSRMGAIELAAILTQHGSIRPVAQVARQLETAQVFPMGTNLAVTTALTVRFEAFMRGTA